jgi:DNA-directed RNA polymerase III subunit RPC4
LSRDVKTVGWVVYDCSASLIALKESKANDVSTPSASTSERNANRGRGHGEKGRARGGVPTAADMTASGPFAMGPALAGVTSARRAPPRSNFASMPSSGPSSGISTPKGAVSVKLEADMSKSELTPNVDDDAYSEPDEGVEIIDIEDVKQIDWMAPDSIRAEGLKKTKREQTILAEGKR